MAFISRASLKPFQKSSAATAHCFHFGNCDFFVFCKLETLFCFVFIRGYGRLDFWSVSYEGGVSESICQSSLN